MSMEFKEEVSGGVAAAMASDDDLKERVRDLVMRAMADRTLDAQAVRDVLREAFAGVGEGMPQRGNQAAAAAREAVLGLDEAVGKAVFALRMAMEEAWDQGKQFTENDMRRTVDDIKNLEDDLMASLKESADKGQGVAKETLGGLYDHLARTGTDTGGQLKAVMELLSNRLASAAHGAGGEFKAQAQDSAERMKSVASGILRGLADGLDRRP